MNAGTIKGAIIGFALGAIAALGCYGLTQVIAARDSCIAYDDATGCVAHVYDQGAVARDSFSNVRPGAILIRNDPGGAVADYLDRYAQIKRSHARVVLSGDCVSACTLVLTMPHWEVCAMPGARLGFHAATIGIDGPISIPGTMLVWNHYPPAVRDWLLSMPITTRVRYRSATSVGIASCKQQEQA